MTTGHVFIATSLDGFVARKDHKIDWLMKQETGQEDHGYENFIQTVEGIVMGRGSFLNVLTFGDWPYTVPVVVMSQTLTDADIPPEIKDKVQLTKLAPKALMESLHQQGWKRAYIDGGKVVQSFLREGLIQDMIITLIPILIGEGIPLFGALPNDLDLELLETRSYPSSLLRTHYKIK